jgi:hypothetical protein
MDDPVGRITLWIRRNLEQETTMRRSLPNRFRVQSLKSLIIGANGSKPWEVETEVRFPVGSCGEVGTESVKHKCGGYTTNELVKDRGFFDTWTEAGYKIDRTDEIDESGYVTITVTLKNGPIDLTVKLERVYG